MSIHEINRPVIATSHSTDSVSTAVEDISVPFPPSSLKQIPQQGAYDIIPPPKEVKSIDLSNLSTSLETLFRSHTSRTSATLKIIGLIGSMDKGCRAYARSIEKQCLSLGVEFERRDLCLASPDSGDGGGAVTFDSAKKAVEEINTIKGVDGLIVFTPIFGGEEDQLLRDMIAPHLDIEALSPLSAAAHDLAAPVPYNHTLERVSTPPSISGSALTAREAVFPCTPMAVCLILMSIPEFWATGPDVDPKRALEGKTIVIVNRSAVFGRPLASMLSNAGATVYSIDIDNTLIFRPSPSSSGRYLIEETPSSLSKNTIFSSADIIISAVPSPTFRVDLQGVCLKPNVGMVNVASTDNFGEEANGRAGWYVGKVGVVTRWCLLLNALMLRQKRAGELLEAGEAEGGSRGTNHEGR